MGISTAEVIDKPEENIKEYKDNNKTVANNKHIRDFIVGSLPRGASYLRLPSSPSIGKSELLTDIVRQVA